eukprot:118188-Amorphochlora_amoeboformis.AAC.3
MSYGRREHLEANQWSPTARGQSVVSMNRRMDRDSLSLTLLKGLHSSSKTRLLPDYPSFGSGEY